MNRREAFFDPFFISLIAFVELIHVVDAVIQQRATRLDIEETLRRSLCCNFYGFVKQSHGFSSMVQTHLHIDEIHVDRWYAFMIASFLHTVDDLPKTLLGIFPISAIVIDVAHHVVGHIHLIVKLAL